MKRITLLLAAAAAAISFSMPVAAEELDTPRMTRQARATSGVSWVALAASPQGRVFRSDMAGSEEAARGLAMNECERKTARTCDTTISVPWDWDVHVVKCAGPRVFMGASAEGNARGYAFWKAQNAGYGGCSTIATY